MAESNETVHDAAEKRGVEATHGDETGRRLEAKLRTFRMMSAVFAITTVIFAAYVFYPSIASLIKGPPVGQRLTGINTQLSSSELAVINGAPNSNFETAGEMMLNLSMPGESINRSVGAYVGVAYLMKQQQVQPLIVNGKPSVIYVGAISCIYCAENRWAMALALSRFGNFSALYKGYSSLGDGDVPTLFWAQESIHGNGSVSFRNYYSSNYINFFSAEYDSEITKSFNLPSSGFSYFIQSATDQYDRLAMEHMSNVSQFRGTPTTLFGTALNGGADAVVFGEPNSTTQNSNLPPLSYMTHAGILKQFKDFNTTFSVQEYAGADVYVAQVCRAINNTAPVCSLKSITTMESIMNNGII